MFTIHGSHVFDLLEEGEFRAVSAEFEPGDTAVLFRGFWNKTGDPDAEEVPAVLEVLSKEDVTEENLLDLPWDTWTVTEGVR